MHSCSAYACATRLAKTCFFSVVPSSWWSCIRTCCLNWFWDLQDVHDGQEMAFEIELLGFEKTPHWHSMTALDKIIRAELVRLQGNQAFKLSRYDLAKQKYLKALKLVDNAYDTQNDQEVCYHLPGGAIVPYLELDHVCQSFASCLQDRITGLQRAYRF